jgi:phosphohistidine phosphatase SixA
VNADNTKLQRQLDEAGRRGAAAMGEAIRALRIPIGAVLTSPTYRALQTVKHAGVGEPTVIEELGDRGKRLSGPMSIGPRMTASRIRCISG